MFEDIEELSKEIDEFKANIRGTEELFRILQKIGGQINASIEDMDIKYNAFLKDLSEATEKLGTESDKIIENNIEVLEKQRVEMEAKYTQIISDASKQQSSFEKSSSEVIERLISQSDKIMADNSAILEKQRSEMEERYTKIVSDIMNQKQSFERSSSDVIERLESMQLEKLPKAINNVNKKVNFIFFVLGAVITINILTFLFK